MCNQGDATKTSDLANIIGMACEYLPLVINFDTKEDNGKLHRRTEVHLNLVQKLELLEKNSNYNDWPKVTSTNKAILNAVKNLHAAMNELRNPANV